MFGVMYNALMVTKTHLCVDCVSCRYDFSIYGDAINNAEVT